jgi:heat-inducible transcriptional repressor
MDQPILSDMNDRSREVFRRVVEGYLTGAPVGSRTLTRSMTEGLGRHDPQRDAGSGIPGPSGQPACLGRPGPDPGRVCGCSSTACWRSARSRCGEDRKRSTPRNWGTNDQDVTTLLDGRCGPVGHHPRRQCRACAKARSRRSAISNSSALRQTGRWWCWSLPMARSKTACSRRPPGQTPSSMREAANFLNALAEGRTFQNCAAHGQRNRPSPAGD